MSNTAAAVAPARNGKGRASNGVAGLPTDRTIVAFVCVYCGRPGRAPSSGMRPRPSTPDFGWPFPVREVVVPCAGRLQPEHVLKAFEDGADAVGVVCCEDGNCHHLEGNRRCSRRLDYLGELLDQIGLGGNRLMLFRLPGSAREDMALGAGRAAPAPAPAPAALGRKIAEVRDAFAARVGSVQANPMRTGDLPEQSPYEVDGQDDSDSDE